MILLLNISLQLRDLQNDDLLENLIMSTAPVETSSKGPKDDIASSKEKWMDKIESLQVPRSEVNKLIMNYLVTEG